MKKQDNSVLSVLIVEDNFSFATELKMILIKLGYKYSDMAETGEEALEIINNTPPDVILMDIELGGKLSGLDVGEKIQDLNIPILFITSFHDEQTHKRASSLKMIGYLVKPLHEYTLLTALDACLQPIFNYEGDSDINILNKALMLKKGKTYHKVEVKNIYYIESDRTYLTIHTRDDKYVMIGSLKSMMHLLKPYSFFKSHQSYILNLGLVKSINTEENVVFLDNEARIPISRRNKRTLEMELSVHRDSLI